MKKMKCKNIKVVVNAEVQKKSQVSADVLADVPAKHRVVDLARDLKRLPKRDQANVDVLVDVPAKHLAVDHARVPKKVPKRDQANVDADVPVKHKC